MMKKITILLMLITVLSTLIFTGCADSNDVSAAGAGNEELSHDELVSKVDSLESQLAELETDAAPTLIPKSKLDYLNGSDLPEVSAAVSAKESAMADLPDTITIKGVEYSTSLTSLTLNNMGLTNEDIADLKYMLNLTELHIYQNNISDLTPIMGLTNLQTLSLFKNNISDLTPIAGLTNLRTLYLRDNEIKDISPLKNLINLTNLDLSDNDISDISALEGMKGMRLLKLNDNNISDITPVEGMVMMDRIHLQNNNITDIFPLWRMDAVTEIYLNGNQITDITPLAELKTLGWLKLSDNPIGDLTPVYELSGLKKLYIINIDLKRTSDFIELEYMETQLPDCVIVTG
ncbi:MAG: leucine-rich repeat domain-containing protein [Oscillospiraceae bacterium]|nr:leucine-rich repeat domain-containing protein [Oscillospiraceae bacterium]